MFFVSCINYYEFKFFYTLVFQNNLFFYFLLLIIYQEICPFFKKLTISVYKALSISEGTLVMFYMKLTHLGSEASKKD